MIAKMLQSICEPCRRAAAAAAKPGQDRDEASLIRLAYDHGDKWPEHRCDRHEFPGPATGGARCLCACNPWRKFDRQPGAPAPWGTL